MTGGFEEARPQSRDFFQKAVDVLAGGVSHESRFAAPFPIYVNRAKGSRKWDVDGNEYVDYAMGSASLLLGHSHPDVVAALQDQAGDGTFYANCHPAEVEWGALVQRLVPSAERVRFVASGTEATMLAIRLARAFAGKPKILRFEGHYHGWHDYAAVGMSPPFDQPGTLGALPESVEATVVCPADAAKVEEALAGDSEIAGVICEVSGGSWGTIPLPDGFLGDLRALADRFGVVLIFDEVITGFRWSPGGVQALEKVTPDLTTLAKVLTGGLPGGAVAGREKIMRLLDPRVQTEGKNPGVVHKGTFNANPLVAAAGVAALRVVETGEPQKQADDIAAKLRTGMQRVLTRHEVAGAVYGESSTFHIYLGEGARGSVEGRSAFDLKSIPKEKVRALQLGLRARGVDLMSYTGGVTSCAHTDQDVVHTLEAFEETIVETSDLPRL